MLSATSSNMNSNAGSSAEEVPSLRPSTTYLCISCQVSFPDGQQQRIHMKEPWHVYNIKRRIASLPPIPRDIFDTQIRQIPVVPKPPVSNSSNDEEKTSDDGTEESASPFQCLFCTQCFTSNSIGLERNLEHMHTEHAMSIPNADTVIDLQSFVGYLATEVRTWHECLYCGAIKQSTLSIQSHMRDKGHCRLNFDREPELVDFWEQGQCEDEDIDAAGKEEEQKVDLSATEIYFASGRVVSSRHAAKARKNASRERSPATLKTISLPHGGDSIPPIVAPELASRQHLSCRQEMGLLGVSVQQRQALVVVEKKAQRSEAAARRAREWVYAKGANSQKFDQVDNQMKWGKQNHKLLPR